MSANTYHNLQFFLNDFLTKYRLVLIYEPPDKPRKNRIPRKERICRFCGKKIPQVKFNNDPHIIPQLLGRNFGVSDFECDTCNNYFSKNETHLADFLGLIRTVLFVGGENNIPTFKSPGESLIARTDDDIEGQKSISISDLNRTSFSIDVETGKNKITYVKNSYIPINVYKALLKIALSILPDDQTDYYKPMFEFISNETNDPFFVQFATVVTYTIHYPVLHPACYLFEKIDPKSLLPMHVFNLYFENLIYEIFIPYNFKDLHLYQSGSKFTSIYCPPILVSKVPDEQTCEMEILDLTSTKMLKNQQGHIVFNLNPEIYKNAQMVNPNTGDEAPFDPNKIVKIKVFQVKNT